VLHDRKRLIAALTGLVALIAMSLVPASPSSAKPDIDDVKEKVDALYHQAEQAQERYHDAKLELTELNKDLAALREDQNLQSERVSGVQADVEDSVVRQYVGEGISAVGQVMVADDPSVFLGQLSTMSAFNELQSGLYDDYATELKALNLRRQATNRRADEVQAIEQRLGAEKAEVDSALADAKDLLSELEAEERAALLAAAASGGPVDLPSNIPASGRAAIAIRYAMAQVGDRYSYGSAGPDAFDCSGLTMMAWAQAGVGLPHSSSAQFGSGPHIAASQLQPGDLVFYYSPISHVGMYIGNGLIVHAANPGAGVRVSGLYSMPYVGAVRPG
jgi:peptidoglycan DL-endopeptidase CwlO